MTSKTFGTSTLQYNVTSSTGNNSSLLYFQQSLLFITILSVWTSYNLWKLLMFKCILNCLNKSSEKLPNLEQKIIQMCESWSEHIALRANVSVCNNFHCLEFPVYIWFKLLSCYNVFSHKFLCFFSKTLNAISSIFIGRLPACSQQSCTATQPWFIKGTWPSTEACWFSWAAKKYIESLEAILYRTSGPTLS